MTQGHDRGVEGREERGLKDSIRGQDRGGEGGECG